MMLREILDSMITPQQKKQLVCALEGGFSQKVILKDKNLWVGVYLPIDLPNVIEENGNWSCGKNE